MKHKILYAAVACAACSVAGYSHAEVNINGFATIGAGQTLTEDKSFGGYENELRFDNGSHLGLQFSSDLGDGLNATAQFMARGEDQWALKAEWAYISYDINDSAKVVVGKQRAPFYMYSDFVDVGYAYHWVTPPDGVYSLLFDSFNAISLVSSNYFGDLESNFQIMVANNEEELSISGDPVPLKLSNTLSLNWTGAYEFASFRVGYSFGELDMPISSLDPLTTAWEGVALPGVDGANVSKEIKVDGNNVSFLGLGLMLDFDDYFIVGEYTRLDLGKSIFGVSNSSYIGAGYRMNDFTFHATYGMDKDETNESLLEGLDEATIAAVPALTALYAQTEATAESFEAEEHYITIGSRWDFHPSSGLKLDITQYVDDKADDDAETLLYRLALTTVF